jgi:hypothetical protein
MAEKIRTVHTPVADPDALGESRCHSARRPRQGYRLVPARVRLLQHLHAGVEHQGQPRGLHRVPAAGNQRDHLVHRVLPGRRRPLQGCDLDQGRRLCRRRHGRYGLVHLRRRRGEQRGWPHGNARRAGDAAGPGGHRTPGRVGRAREPHVAGTDVNDRQAGRARYPHRAGRGTPLRSVRGGAAHADVGLEIYECGFESAWAVQRRRALPCHPLEPLRRHPFRRRRRRMASDAGFWLLGRVGDVINGAGHRLSTIEIEAHLSATTPERGGCR